MKQKRTKRKKIGKKIPGIFSVPCFKGKTHAKRIFIISGRERRMEGGGERLLPEIARKKEVCVRECACVCVCVCVSTILLTHAHSNAQS